MRVYVLKRYIHNNVTIKQVLNIVHVLAVLCKQNMKLLDFEADYATITKDLIGSYQALLPIIQSKAKFLFSNCFALFCTGVYKKLYWLLSANQNQ